MRMLGEGLRAPHLIDLEVLSVIRSAVAAGDVTAARAGRAVANLRILPIQRSNHVRLIQRCWELRDNVTPYDAAYVALAEATSSLLLTADGRLARAPGIRCEVEVLVVPHEPTKPEAQ